MYNDAFRYKLTKRKLLAKQQTHLKAARKAKHVKNDSQWDTGNKENVAEPAEKSLFSTVMENR
jgi:hypothetical protein